MKYETNQSKVLLERIANERLAEMTEYEIKQRAKKERVNFILGCVYFIAFFLLVLIVSIFANDSTNTLWLCIASCGSIVFFICFCVFKCKKSDIELALEYVKSNPKKELKHLNYDDFGEGVFSNFDISKSVALNISNYHQSRLLIDDNKKQFIIQKGDQYSEVYKFSDVLGYEVFENGQREVQGRVGSALIGEVFFGMGGAIIGGSRRRSINEKCTQLTLIVRINNLRSPQIELIFFNNENIDKSSSIYKNKIDNVHLICSHLEYMMNCKKIEDYNKSQPVSNISVAKKQQLRELKEMLDDGLITQEDYEQKKKQILGL